MSKSKFAAALMAAALSWGTFTLAAVPGSQAQQSQWNADSAKDLRAKAYYAKTKADELKAAVCQKSEYDALIAQFKAGDESYLAGDYTAAVQTYLKVLEGFASLCAQTAKAKDKASVAVEDAKERVAKSEQEAIKADQIKPLGDEPVEGIEDHDAKMLEDDDFSEARNSAVEISPTIGEETDQEASEESSVRYQDITDSETVETEGDVSQEDENSPGETAQSAEADEQQESAVENEPESESAGESEGNTEEDAAEVEADESESTGESSVETKSQAKGTNEGETSGEDQTQGDAEGESHSESEDTAEQPEGASAANEAAFDTEDAGAGGNAAEDEDDGGDSTATNGGDTQGGAEDAQEDSEQAAIETQSDAGSGGEASAGNVATSEDEAGAAAANERSDFCEVEIEFYEDIEESELEEE